MPRYKKPTDIKIIQGTFRKDRANPNEPRPTGNLVDPPDYFTDEQKDIWNYAIQNAPAGLLKKLDISTLEIWVMAYSTYREAAQKLRVSGQVVKSPNNYPMVSPYLANMNKQAIIMLKAANEMGFTPSSRSKVSIEQEASTDDVWAKLSAR